MTEKKVQVEINGISYTLITDESEEHIREIASYVGKKINEAKADNLSYDKELVLTSLNIANDLFNVGNKYKRLKEDSAEAVEKFPSLVENYKKAIDHNDQLIERVNQLSQQNESLENKKNDLEKQIKSNEESDKLIEKLRNEAKRLQQEAASLKAENEQLKGKL
ncbi:MULTISPECIES: cell division protein ZapA [Anaerococcus]|uniref:cell division protein ZapA n=1 Tax=Anaerococcus TaxID=165779 RepID=UPI0015F2F418|nr:MULTISPECIES: cell division protein ZapA [Anaerococcus]MBP2069807.1 cell division protein ZapA [Anaerococcus nagyae]MDU1829463.1 cell division protein ZapA [Anaerococcus sp.]MDU1863707.1 cell division protein ZapA [Anaerococcus sp.]MDU2353474.1 cell division protein ZapA [Anaerococcus sp.]MDU2565759.1 cell division protein ZapA [Anaerococcus sp.]